MFVVRTYVRMFVVAILYGKKLVKKWPLRTNKLVRENGKTWQGKYVWGNLKNVFQKIYLGKMVLRKTETFGFIITCWGLQTTEPLKWQCAQVHAWTPPFWKVTKEGSWLEVLSWEPLTSFTAQVLHNVCTTFAYFCIFLHSFCIMFACLHICSYIFCICLYIFAQLLHMFCIFAQYVEQFLYTCCTT